MLTTTWLTVIVIAWETCHLNAHVIARNRLQADDASLWHGLRISTFLWAWCIASFRPLIRVLRVLILLTISTKPVLDRFLIQIIEPLAATVHARVFIEGFVHLKNGSVSVIRALSADYFNFTVIHIITLGHMTVWLSLCTVVVCSSGRLYRIIWQECVNVNFGLLKRIYFIFIFSNTNFYCFFLC